MNVRTDFPPIATIHIVLSAATRRTTKTTTIHHTNGQPAFDLTYILTANDTAVTAKVYVIDSEDYCTMLLVEEY